MHTSLQLIDLAKQKLALKHELTLPVTDYRLAKLMDLRTQTISQWRSGRTHIGTEFARKFAEACELPLEYVYACIEHDRAANSDVKLILEHIAQKFAATAGAAIVAVFLMVGTPSNSYASAANLKLQDYTLCEV